MSACKGLELRTFPPTAPKKPVNLADVAVARERLRVHRHFQKLKEVKRKRRDKLLKAREAAHS